MIGFTALVIIKHPRISTLYLDRFLHVKVSLPVVKRRGIQYLNMTRQTDTSILSARNLIISG